MRKYLLTLLSCSLLFALFSSCKKEVSAPPIEKPDNSAIFPTTQKEKERVQTIKEIGSILKQIYRKGWVTFEVNAAIKTEYYEDETVLLRDLLKPETSPLYKTQKFISSGAKAGVFKKFFAEELSKGNYPNLIKAIGQPPSSINLRQTDEWPAVDTSNEIWTDQYGYSIYFPYSEDYPLVTPFDPNINTVNGELVTIVSADREADSGPGQEPYIQNDPNLPQCPDNICYNTVTVDDNYADGDYGHHPTHIVGVGAEPTRILPSSPPPGTNVNRVFHGWSRLTKQLDKFISFIAGNGGGSDIKVNRISGYLQLQNQQVTNFANGDGISIDYKRKDINKGRWKRVYGVWDPDWVTDNLEQVYVVWEDDASGSKTFTGSLGTTITISQGNTVTGNIGYNITVTTQDEIVTQRKITRAAYFGAAKSDQGWGFNLCDKNGSTCRYDNTFLSTGNWPAYDGNANAGAIWAYTWPYNSY